MNGGESKAGNKKKKWNHPVSGDKEDAEDGASRSWLPVSESDQRKQVSTNWEIPGSLSQTQDPELG